MKFLSAACPGKVSMDCDGSQGDVDVCLLKVVRDCTERFVCLCFSTFYLFIYKFDLVKYGLWIFFLVLSANKEFDDWFLLLCSELSSFDLLYVEGEMSDFWKLHLSDIYCFGSGIIISKLQFTVRSETLFGIGL